MKKLPIGVQWFQGLRNDGYLYVDKTDFIYELIHTGKVYFLSRPRRFGKSLFLSTLRAYWEGKKELFQDLKIAELEEKHSDAWQSYPVFYFDFNGEKYENEKNALEDIIDEQLRRWEKEYHISEPQGTLGERFRTLLIEANKQSGLRCVVLVDEYDKPLLEVMGDSYQETHNKAVLKGFFSSLKSFDEYIRFIFITGVTKFEKVSIFSDLNQLRDISLSKDYASVCGITEEELDIYFTEAINRLAKNQDLSYEECREQLQMTYDGYRFHPQGKSVYNPFSLLSAFADGEFMSYWFSTGTPAFLTKKVKESGFDVRKITDNTLYASESMLSDYRADSRDLVPMLYQTGYLSIAEYDKNRRRYTLSFPNKEVEYGFLESLFSEYVPKAEIATGMDKFTLV